MAKGQWAAFPLLMEIGDSKKAMVLVSTNLIPQQRKGCVRICLYSRPLGVILAYVLVVQPAEATAEAVPTRGHITHYITPQDPPRRSWACRQIQVRCIVLPPVLVNACARVCVSE